MGRPFVVHIKLGQPNNSDNIVSHPNNQAHLPGPLWELYATTSRSAAPVCWSGSFGGNPLSPES
jgi:hypothetical protein